MLLLLHKLPTPLKAENGKGENGKAESFAKKAEVEDPARREQMNDEKPMLFEWGCSASYMVCHVVSMR